MQVSRFAVRISCLLLGLLLAFGLSAAIHKWLQPTSKAALIAPTAVLTNVPIGGGGYVTGIYIHPVEPDLIYLRTDMGGFYRWQAATERWLPITDRFSAAEQNYYGGEALALDPNNPEVVYIAAGKYLDDGPGAIFRSDDRGGTWQKLGLELPMGGNEINRWLGSRLVVDPQDSAHLLFGSRQSGLWMSRDVGVTWQQVTDIPILPDDPVGITGIVFDPVDAAIVYATHFESGVYVSRDRGSRWQRLPDSPQAVQQIEVATDQSLYAVGDTVYRYGGQSWETIAPRQGGGAEVVFNALSLDPHDAEHLVVSSKEDRETEIFESRDRGVTWRRLSRRLQGQVPWWTDFMNSQPAIAAIRLDPHHPQRLWLTDWYGVWRTDQLDRPTSVWKNYVAGHEQVVSFALMAPPTGPVLVSGLADVDGFVHDDTLATYPQQRLGVQGSQRISDTYSLAYCEQDPTIFVRVGGTRWDDQYLLAVSNNAGQTWQASPRFPADKLPIDVAITSPTCDSIVVILDDEPPLYSRDRGRTWATTTGLPDGPDGPWNWSKPLVAAPALDQGFYYVTNNGELYQSRDGGESFELLSQGWPAASEPILQVDPRQPERLGLALAEGGLYYSEDAGKSFQAIDSVTTAHLLAFGKPTRGRTPLYIYGTLTDQKTGLFRSWNLGEQWEELTSPTQPIGNKPNVLAASQQIDGLVFVGTNGRGVFYGY